MVTWQRFEELRLDAANDGSVADLDQRRSIRRRLDRVQFDVTGQIEFKLVRTAYTRSSARSLTPFLRIARFTPELGCAHSAVRWLAHSFAPELDGQLNFFSPVFRGF